MRIPRAAAVLAALLVSLCALVGFAAPSQAAQRSIDIPGFDVCPKNAPAPEPPNMGLSGVFLGTPATVRPAANQWEADPRNLKNEAGLAGMQPITYDLGCAFDPTSWGRTMTAFTDSNFSEGFLGLSYALTSWADAVDRQAWNPSWVPSLLGRITDRANDVIEARILMILLPLGLLASTVLLANRARRGDVAGVWSAVSWVVIVLLIAGFITVKPTTASTSVQRASGELTSALYGNAVDPATAVSNDVFYAVHYQGWLRRTFGTTESGTAKEFGPKVLATTRFTYDEYQRTDPSLAKNKADREARVKALKELTEAKQKRFKELAGQIQEVDPSAYYWFTGQHGGIEVSLYEAGFAFASSFLRLACALLLIMCLILLCVLGLVWLAASPWLVTPPGQETARTLLDNTGRVVGYVLIAAIGSWLFNIYTEIVMQPGWSSWWSLLLMIVGSLIAWTLIRPDRKALSMLSGGRVWGGSKTMRLLTRRVLPALAGGAIGGAVAEKLDDKDEEKARKQAEKMASYTVPTTPVSRETTPLVEAAPVEVYSREPVAAPAPPPADTVGEDVYTRPARRYDDVLAEKHAEMEQKEKKS